MSFAVKYLSVIGATGAGKGQPADETRNRNRRRKSMSGHSVQVTMCWLCMWKTWNLLAQTAWEPDDNDTSAV